MNHVFTEHPKPKIKLGVLFLRRKRAGFTPEWGETIEKEVRAQLESAPFEVFIPETKIVDVESMHAALDECEASNCGVLTALQPTMSDGRMAPVLGRRSSTPVVFWATPEKQEGDMISACSLVGAHTFAATLAQAGHPFEFAYGMPGEDRTVVDFNNAVYRAHAYGAIRSAYAGLVGYHAPGFTDMHVEPASLRTELNIEFFHIAIKEFADGLAEVSDADAKADLEQVKTLGLVCESDVSEEDLLFASKYYLHLKRLMDNTPLQALAVRDWPELCGTQWPYLAMSRLASEGYAIACEGDLDGALTCLAATTAGCGACYLSDWLEHDEHHITLWHGGAAPLQLCRDTDSDTPPTITNHFNSGKPAVVNATLKSGLPITLLRLWHCHGQYRFTAIEGETVEPKRHLKGTNGLGFFPDVDLNDYFVRMIRAGFPHHPVVVQGHEKRQLETLMANLGVECVA
ncbi:MAG: sugar isomerase [Verrucomicrobiota bacterium]